MEEILIFMINIEIYDELAFLFRPLVHCARVSSVVLLFVPFIPLTSQTNANIPLTLNLDSTG